MDVVSPSGELRVAAADCAKSHFPQVLAGRQNRGWDRNPDAGDRGAYGGRVRAESQFGDACIYANVAGQRSPSPRV
jgi:hypothetical protein